MSRQLSLQILLPIEGYNEDKICNEEEIELKQESLVNKPDNVYYRRLKEKSIYIATDDIIKFVRQKYNLEKISEYSIQVDYLGEYQICFQGNKYTVEKDELKQLEKEHIKEHIYCNELKYCSFSWFYTSIGTELVPEDIVIIDDELIKKATNLLGYESKVDLIKGLADVIEDNVDGEDKFMASLILAKEMAGRINGRAVFRYE